MTGHAANTASAAAPSRPGRAPRPRRLVALLAGLLTALATAEEAPGAPAATPRATFAQPPAVVLPGQTVHLCVDWDLPAAAEPAPAPTGTVANAWLTWGSPQRHGDGVTWEGDLVALCPGRLQGTLACTAALPALPADVPRSMALPIPPRFLVNLYAPCRYTLRTCEVPLPDLEIAAMPPLPAGFPPYLGLMGDWLPTLTAPTARLALHEPFAVDLVFRGHGPSALLRPPTLAHPDLSAGPAVLERDPGDGTIRLRWTVTAARLPLTPLRAEFAVFDGTRYVAHRLQARLDFRPVRPAAGIAAGLPPVLTRFHALPVGGGPATTWPGARAGAAVAVAGVLVGVLLCRLAQRRDFRHSPAGTRQAALHRLRHTRIRQVQELGPIYHDLRLCLGLPSGASAADIAAASRAHDAELAAELCALEQRRFDPSASQAVDTNRLASLLRRLSGSALLAVLGALGAATPAPDDPELAAAETAFRQQDFVQASLALMQMRRHAGESPELLMNLGNAAWFTGRHVEALAMYERALRLAPRRADVRSGLNWLRATAVPAAAAATALYPRPGRDALRPDEWLFLAGLALGSGATVAAACRWWRKPTTAILAATAAAAFLCLTLAATQRVGPYRPGATARVTEARTLHAAPAESADVVGTCLPKGALVTPVEWRPGWTMVRTAAVQGWLPDAACVQVW